MSFRNAKGGYIRPGYDPLEVANPPTGAGATAGNTTASVSFTAPSNTGGGAITNYYAVSNPGQITASSVTSPISVSGLTNGTEYTFKVWGENSYGPSAYSAPTGSVTPVPPFIEDVFSTYLYTGNSSTQTITNGIDLSGEGGMVWRKSRGAVANHILMDTTRGIASYLVSNTTDAAGTGTDWISSFNSNGFTMNANSANGGTTYASWTFRQAEKFFDVVTFTTDANGAATVNHSLGSTPGVVITKASSRTSDWKTYHRSLGDSKRLSLNLSDAEENVGATWISVNSTQISFPSSLWGNATYVAYLFAHDAGGFGDSGSDNVITCGSYTGNGTTTGPTVNLGYEPQWILVKRATVSTGQWEIYDSMRGMTVGGNEAILRPNSSDAEFSTVNRITPTATGFFASDSDGDVNANGSVYIYIAIRRGPMKTPETGTSVFTPVSQSTAATAPRTVTAGFPVDFVLFGDQPTNWGYNWSVQDRLRGGPNVLFTSGTSSENTGSNSKFDSNTAFRDGWVSGGTTGIYEMFRRAPGFFDVVCFTGDGTGNQMVTHNLGVTPELIITKKRSGSLAFSWYVYGYKSNSYLILNQTDAEGSATITAATSTQFSVFAASDPQVAYLFATCAGVSKVGSYTGTGTTLQVNCGFTGGARFVMIKRTDSTGDWYVWDSARGIVAGNDPYLLLNSTAAEVTNTDYVDTYSAGFEISSTAPAAINANGGTYLFLAIA